ncbi:hypothetical protein [Mucilaginibacter rubeus]|uniref:hypothetical protein n=1 Tax=Mucilaginibacter rubeus TaxID=2027860 RepID=UPI001669BC23|nr:hypothetical protein [Mucilaginibacter rubeus]GGA95605.1 hypothetical protein GCM10011500_09200 [Mucilaginibacter rubeus]
MEKMKSLASQLREQMAKTAEKATAEAKKTETEPSKKATAKRERTIRSPILTELMEYDNSDHKTMVHFRLDKESADFINKFKIATGVDVTRFVAFAVRHLISNNPELKTVIKQFIQNSSL